VTGRSQDERVIIDVVKKIRSVWLVVFVTKKKNSIADFDMAAMSDRLEKGMVRHSCLIW